MKVQVSLDSQYYEKKPKEIPRIKYRTAGRWQELELKELADRVGNKGCSMIPAHLAGGIAARNFRAMQLFVLDFDHGCSFREIQGRCRQLGLPIAFAYYTFSSSEEEERFRVIFVSECLVDDSFIAGIAMKMLHTIFPECDPACANLDRLFLGGKGLICVNEDARIALVQLLLPFYRILDSNGNYCRSIRNFCRKERILLFNNRPAMGNPEQLGSIFDEKTGSAIKHIIGEHTFASFFVLESVGVQQSITCKVRPRELDMKSRGNCKLLEDFREGEDIGHAGRFALLMNLMHIKGGQKYFFQVLERYRPESVKKWQKDLYYMKGYRPQRCSSCFCPYYGKCEDAGTIVDTLAMDRRIYMEEKEYCSLAEASECLKINLETAFNSSKKGMHLIRAQTAIGKTTAYIELVRNHPEENFLIAVPTNILKEQVLKDLCCSGIPEEEIFVTASVRGNGFFPEEVQRAVAEAHDRGMHDRTRQIVLEYYKKMKEMRPEGIAVLNECMKIMAGIRAVQGERIVVTTHAFFMQMPADFVARHTVIIDEDILQLQVFSRICTVTGECLQRAATAGVPYYSRIAEEMLEAEPDEYRRISPYRGMLPDGLTDSLDCRDGEGNLYDILYAGAYVKLRDDSTGENYFHYFCPARLPVAKYILLSATLHAEIYEKYFRGSMDVYDYPEKEAAYCGRFVQFTYHSLGRKDLAGKRQVFSYAREQNDGKKIDIITFREFEETEGCGNAKGLHFGNTTGINDLKGHDIAVIGTPYKPPVCYKMIACCLGADVNRNIDKAPKVRRVKYKNRSFLITTYEEPLLREVQLYSIESELEQCVGRARLLRSDCRVFLFSCFPCGQAQLHQADYLAGYEGGDRAVQKGSLTGPKK